LATPQDDEAEIARLKTEWWGLETRARTQARQHEPLVTELADTGFELARRGADLTDARRPGPLWEVFMGLAFAQLYNTSMSAWELAYTGFYIQSQMLARLITEYLGVVWYMPKHPEEAAKWNADRKIPGGGALLEKVFQNEASLGENFHQLRKYLHKYAHLDWTGLTDLILEVDESNTVAVAVGGVFHQPKFQAVARILLPLHASIPAAMEQWHQGADAGWSEEVHRFVQRVANVVDEYDRRAAGQVPR
jgi:hypothetical protein